MVNGNSPVWGLQIDHCHTLLDKLKSTIVMQLKRMLCWTFLFALRLCMSLWVVCVCMGGLQLLKLKDPTLYDKRTRKSKSRQPLKEFLAERACTMHTIRSGTAELSYISRCQTSQIPHIYTQNKYHEIKKIKLECGPMPNVMAALLNIGGALCSMPQSFADAHY